MGKPVSLPHIRQAAYRFVEHWRSGNHRYVLDEIAQEPPTIACYLIACMVHHMEDTARDADLFIKALGAEAEKEEL